MMKTTGIQNRFFARWPITRWAKEPLVHFALIGGVLFGVYAWLNRGAADLPHNPARVIRISAAEVDWLRETWARQWSRSPSELELRGLVSDYLKEQLLAAEARELGLEENDTIVRRRLAQKMEFLVQDVFRRAEPSDDELRQFFSVNRQLFDHPARISFTQVFFSEEKNGTDAARRAGTALARLTGKGASSNPDELGDRSLLERQYTSEEQTAVAGTFGPRFAQEVFATEPGGWRGPIKSAYGVHLVRVVEKKAARPRQFAEVRGQVIEKWRTQQEQNENQKYLAALLKKYDVVVDEEVKGLMGPIVLSPQEQEARP